MEFNWAALQRSAEDATKPIPDGDYVVTVTKAEVKTASTGSAMISVSLGVSGGPSNGRVLFNNFVLTPDKPFALNRWFNGFAAFGIGPDFWAGQPSMEQAAQALVGKTAIVVVGHRTYQGREVNDCTNFRPASALEIAAAGDSGGSSGAAAAPPIPVQSSAPAVPLAPPAGPPTLPSENPAPPPGLAF